MMDQTGHRRMRLGLVWHSPDPASTARRLSAALGRSVDPHRIVAIDGLTVTIDTSSEGERFETLRIVAPDVEPADPLAIPIAVGWATVDPDRAERDLRAAGVLDGPAVDAAKIDALGAAARRADGSAFGVPLLLLEPVTEGRLAARLARHGEGPCAILVGEDEAGGPVLVNGSPPAGPYLLVNGGGYHPVR
jgi:hypothetical protein